MIDWDRIDTVLLDMDGTLLDLHFDNYFWLEYLPLRYAQMQGREAAEVREQLVASYQRMRGTLDWYCLDFWARTLDLDLVALKQEIVHKISPRPGALEFLAWLNSQGKQALLITNAHPHSLDLKMAHVPMAHHFDALISSHHYQVPKEQAPFWQALLDRHYFDPGRTLFIDDTEAVLDSAGDFGVAHLLCVTQPDLQLPERPPGRYRAFNDFAEIFRADGQP